MSVGIIIEALGVFPPIPRHMSARELVARLERDFAEFEAIEEVKREIANERCIPIRLRRQAHVHGRRYKQVGVARSAA